MATAPSETVEARILRVLEQTPFPEGEEPFKCIRSKSEWVTMILSTLKKSHEPIHVACPKDEARLVDCPIASEQGNQLTLCPLSQEVYEEFLIRVQQLEPSEMNYQVFFRKDSGQWEMRE